MDNGTLNYLNWFARGVIATLVRLGGFAPAAIEDGVSRRDARGGGCILASHDDDKDADSGPGVAPRQRANFRSGLGHSGFAAVRLALFNRRKTGVIRNEARHDGKKRDNGKIRLRVVMWRARHELNDLGFHEHPSQTAMAINPTSASEIR